MPKKHRPPAGRDWDYWIESTGLGKKVARYKTGLSHQAIRSIEMQFHDRPESLNENVGLICEIWPDRFYYVICDDTIGAALGEETRFVKVVRHNTGFVHGYPITEDELIEEFRKHHPDKLGEFQERCSQ